MDRIKKYQDLLQKEMEYHAELQPTNSDIKFQFVMNVERNQCILLALGWQNKVYKHYFLFHLEIIDGKIWLHENRTDIDIAKILVEKGIQPCDIFIAYLTKVEQKDSGYAMV